MNLLEEVQEKLGGLMQEYLKNEEALKSANRLLTALLDGILPTKGRASQVGAEQAVKEAISIFNHSQTSLWRLQAQMYDIGTAAKGLPNSRIGIWCQEYEDVVELRRKCDELRGRRTLEEFSEKHNLLSTAGRTVIENTLMGFVSEVRERAQSHAANAGAVSTELTGFAFNEVARELLEDR